MLAIDTNAHETDLFNAIAANSADAFALVEARSIVREPLRVGDVALRDDDGAPTWTFEIKRGTDWAASIVDKRLPEQRRRALANPEDVGTFAYIFEGIPPANDGTAPYGRLPASTVYGSILRTSLRDGLHVFYTRNALETADFLMFALLQQRAGRLSFGAPSTAGERGVKRKGDWAADHPTEAALLSVPGMGEAAAAALAQHFGSLAAILAADEDDLADTMVKKRRLGPALAKKLKAL